MEFDKNLSAEYEKGIRRTLPSYDAMLRLTTAFMQMHLPQKASLLSIGVGSGNELIHLANANNQWHFTALDPSQAMLDITSQKLNTASLDKRVILKEGTILNTTMAKHFDGATCLLVLHFIKPEEQLVTLQKIAACLTKGAPFVLACKCGQQGTEQTEEQFALWRAYWQQNTRLTYEQINDMETSIRALHFLSETDVIHLLEEAGFTRISRFFSTTLFSGWTCYKR